MQSKYLLLMTVLCCFFCIRDLPVFNVTGGLFFHKIVFCRYKERVRERRIKSLDPSSTMRFIDSKNWMFLKSGLDDFRNGVPVPARDDIFVKVWLLICLSVDLCNF